MPLWWACVSITGGTNQLQALGVRTKLDTSPLENILIQGNQVRGVMGTQEAQFARSKNTFKGASQGSVHFYVCASKAWMSSDTCTSS